MLSMFRTMYKHSEVDGPRFAEANDPRVTRFGQWLRRTKVDEWPQFFNVIIGDMSLVGPRPERPGWAKQYRESIPYYDLRHVVRPGITGWAQVAHGYTSDIEGTRAKLELDLYYIKYFGFQLDAIVLFRTISVIGAGS